MIFNFFKKKTNQLYFPKTTEEVQKIVKENSVISIEGTKHAQGGMQHMAIKIQK